MQLIFKVLLPIIVLFYENLFYTQRIPSCFGEPRDHNDGPKHVAVRCVYRLILIYVCKSVVSTIFHTQLTHGLFQ